ncbi:RNA-binding protein Puf1 [Theileria orientalis]|uniref:RNA-binding protein Puf1 n=1 Tax=Theileria orientalis TaxID=68886 RepID=A0A976QTT5_THEOR|nr:RNA-binding protein Puf1 [Theileria orientalis]
MSYSYFNFDKNLDLDPSVQSSNFGTYNPVNTVDYLNQNMDHPSHLMNSAEFDDTGLCDQVKPFNTDYVNCESFSTRYTDSSFDQNAQNMSMNYSMDSLTETMLKQLDTPKLFSHNDVDYPDSLRLNSLDPQMLRRLYDAGINVNADSKDDYYVDNLDCYYDNLSSDLDSTKKDHLKTSRRRGRRVEEAKPMQKSGSSVKSPSMKPSSKSKNGSKGSFGTLNYSWLKDSFFNCQILGNVVSIAQDQTGCRMLQRQLECNDHQFISSVLNEVLDNLYMLMTDPFGNYLCQKLMSVCDAEQLGKIITSCEPQFISICLNMHGTRAIQKLIEVVTEENITRITSILSTGVVDLVNDLNGNHVIQKCLVSLSSEHCDFIYKAMNENCVYLATHRHGCCVMQRCIDAASPAQRAKLIDTISSKTLELVEDAYGNYVIQYVLRLKDDEINSRIVSFLCEDVTKFAKQKFSSNVVERCLIFCPLEVRSTLISKFLNVPFDVLKDLILDPFGNYVIQRVLNVAQPDELTSLLDSIQPHLEELKVASSGKRIAAKISRRSSTSSSSTSANSGSTGIVSNYSAYGPGNNIFEIFSETSEDGIGYPGYLSSEYPSLSSNQSVQQGASYAEKSKGNDPAYNINDDRDYIIDLINKTNSSKGSASTLHQGRMGDLVKDSLDFSTLDSEKYDQNDPFVRDFCDMFDGYDRYQSDSYSSNLWANNM